MLKLVDRFAELYELLGLKFVIYKGHIWREYQKMIVPLGPAKLGCSITDDGTQYLLSKFPKALLVRWTDGFSSFRLNGEWYAVILDKFYNIDELSSKNRSEIRRGFKNCMVEMVDARFIAENGYEVFISAFERYKGVQAPKVTKEDFKNQKLVLSKFEDIVHFWGVFYKDRLIAYSENYVYDNIEVNYSTIKLHPDYLKFYSSYALVYTMNKYYLKEQKFEYVNDGYKNILHQSNIQKFLMDKFKFRKKYTNLYAYYKPYLSIYLNVTFPIRNSLKGIHPKLDALYTMEEIRRKCKNA